MLGERTAEEIKMTLGSAFPLPDEPEAEIRGRDMVSGLPRTVVVSSAEIRQALEEPLHAIIDAVRTTLDQTPPELAGDIMDRGIVLTGGGALLRGLDERLRHETGMPVHVAEDPLDLGRPRRRQVRRGVRGAPAGARLRAAALLMGASTSVWTPPRAALAERDRLDVAQPSQSLLVALVLACVTLITLDYHGGSDSPVEPARARRRRGVRPGRGRRRPPPCARSPPSRPGSAPTTRCATRSRELEAENAELAAQVATAGYDRNRLEEYDGLTAAASRPRLRAGAGPGGRGSAPAQSFSRTVTIDAGSAGGRRPRHDRAQQRRPGRPGAARRPAPPPPCC